MTVHPRAPPDTDIGVSAFSSPAALTAAYERIEEEIQALESAIIAWKIRRNTLSVTARLPSEILSAIFCYVIPERTLMPPTNLPSPRRPKWFQVTHVCTHWRNIALECPNLWTRISFSHSWWTEEMLMRSKAAPLTIATPIFHSNHKSIISALSNISRTNTLHLEPFISKVDWDKVVANLMNPAPLLERFVLHCSYRNAATSYHSTLPYELFSGDAPRLRELELRNCNVPWTSPVLCTLTSLKMYYRRHIIGEETLMPSLDQVISALKCIPCLEDLSLQHVLPTFREEDSINFPESAIPLPRLKSIHLEDNLQACTYFLNQLPYPATTSVTLVSTIPWLNSDDLLKNLPTLRCLGGIFNKSCPFRRLTTYCGVGSIKLTTFDTMGAQEHPSGPPVSRVDVRLVIPIRGRNMLQMLLRPLLASISMQSLESLKVVQEYRSADIWQSIFDTLTGTQLKHLEVVGNGSGIACLRAFSTSLAVTPAQEGRSDVPLPFLQELAITGWDFSERAHGETCFERLKTWLEERKKHHAGIRKLSLVECHSVTLDDVKKLRKVVTHVKSDTDALRSICDPSYSRHERGSDLDEEGVGVESDDHEHDSNPEWEDWPGTT